MTEEEDAEDRALEEALARVVEIDPRTHGREPTSAEVEAVADAIRRVFVEHGKALKRKGLDTEGAVADLTAQLEQLRDARRKRDEARRELNRAQAGAHGPVRYHG